MKIEFIPLFPELLPACREFNQRMLRQGEPPFLLPEKMPAPESGSRGSISWNHYLAVDETGAVRGGVLLVEQPAWLAGRELSVLNIQSPISEGIVDRAFSGVGLRMLQFLNRRNPFSYAVGMGGEQNPFARLLAAAGWSIHRVPFQFDVVRAAPFLRELGPFRQGRKRTLARLAAASGIGSAAAAIWRGIHRHTSGRGYSLEAIDLWHEPELDAVWNRCRAELDFSVLRDGRGATDLHPFSQARLKRYSLRAHGTVVGWSVGLVTKMEGSPHFGNLRVGTILDALAPREHLGALIGLTQHALRDLDAELIIGNLTHRLWQNELRRLGFLTGPSNYLLAMSKPLASEILAKSAGFDRIYVTRADGDGRIHL